MKINKVHLNYLALFLLSIGVISFQIVLMQVLSYVGWYHFAYMIVSLALLGFGASGSFLTLFKDYSFLNKSSSCSICMIIAGLTMSLLPILVHSPLLNFDFYLIFLGKTEIMKFIFVSFLYFIPFFFSAMAIGLLLCSEQTKVSYYYFFNMLGSGVGAIIVLIILNNVSIRYLLSYIAPFPVLGGLLILDWKKKKQSLGLLIISLIIIMIPLIKTFSINPSQFKDLIQTLNLPQSKIVKSSPGTQGIFQLVSSPHLKRAPGLSFKYQGKVSPRDIIFINGHNYGSVSKGNGFLDTSLLNYSTEVVGYRLRNLKTSLILSARGTSGIELALSNNVQKIWALEYHNEVFRLLKQKLEYSQFKNINLVNMTARSFLLQTNQNFDLIHFPPVGHFHGNIGLQALATQFELTKEFFEMAWKHLTPNGVILVSSWIDFPLRNPLKIITTLKSVLLNHNLENPELHIAAIKSWGNVTFVLKKSPLTTSEIHNINKICSDLFFDPLILPQNPNFIEEQYNKEKNNYLSKMSKKLLSEKSDIFLQNYKFNIYPATDQSPYFSQFLKLKFIPEFLQNFKMRQIPYLEMGSFILILTMISLFIMSFLFIIFPLLVKKNVFRISKRKLEVVLYFGSTGLAYMFLEIILIQKVNLWTGAPLYSVTLVLFTLLTSSSMGSYFSQKINMKKILNKILLMSTPIIIILFNNVISTLQTKFDFFPFFIKNIIIIVMMIPMGFLIGIPFPMGLRSLFHDNEKVVPWAWGINGFFSVMAPSLVTLLVILKGFNIVFYLVAFIYLLVFGWMTMKYTVE